MFQNPALTTATGIQKTLCGYADGGFVRARCFGHSVCGQKLWSLEIGTMRDPVLIVGGVHGMEWASALCVLRLADNCVDAVHSGSELFGIDLRRELSKNGAVFVPLLNPDGFDIRQHETASLCANRRRLHKKYTPETFAFWQANARGVDLNHNFNAGFYKAKAAVEASGITRPGPTKYGGRFPFSEPETRAARTLCARLRPRSLYCLHSQGEEIYWSYGEHTPPQSHYMAETLASLCGYRVCVPDGTASHAGFKDWFIERYRRPGFTLELGRGKNPLPYGDFAGIWDKVERALTVSLIL